MRSSWQLHRLITATLQIARGQLSFTLARA